MKLKNRRLSALAAVTLVAGLALSACGGDDGDDNSSDGGGGDNTYTFLPKNLGNAYFDTSDNAGKAAIESFDGTYQEVGPDKASPDAQVPFINTAAQQGVAALIVSANDKEAICDALNEARDAGVKVVTFDSDTNPECRDLFINQATAEGIAKVQVDMIAEQIGDAGEVAILSAAANATNQNAWIADMEKQFAESHPNIQLVDTVVRRRRRPDVVRQDRGAAAGTPEPEGDHLADHRRHRGRGPLPVHLGRQGQGRADRPRDPEPDAGVRRGRHGHRVRTLEPG